MSEFLINIATKSLLAPRRLKSKTHRRGHISFLGYEYKAVLVSVVLVGQDLDQLDVGHLVHLHVGLGPQHYRALKHYRNLVLISFRIYFDTKLKYLN